MRILAIIGAIFGSFFSFGFTLWFILGFRNLLNSGIGAVLLMGLLACASIAITVLSSRYLLRSEKKFQRNLQKVIENTPGVDNVPFYRSYWPFAAIYLLLPPVIGIIILINGDIYRHIQGKYIPIKRSEKITLTIVAFLLWYFGIRFYIQTNT